jgi:hypothetical protein
VSPHDIYNEPGADISNVKNNSQVFKNLLTSEKNANNITCNKRTIGLCILHNVHTSVSPLKEVHSNTEYRIFTFKYILLL